MVWLDIRILADAFNIQYHGHGFDVLIFPTMKPLDNTI